VPHYHSNPSIRRLTVLNWSWTPPQEDRHVSVNFIEGNKFDKTSLIDLTSLSHALPMCGADGRLMCHLIGLNDSPILPWLTLVNIVNDPWLSCQICQIFICWDPSPFIYICCFCDFSDTIHNIAIRTIKTPSLFIKKKKQKRGSWRDLRKNPVHFKNEQFWRRRSHALGRCKKPGCPQLVLVSSEMKSSKYLCALEKSLVPFFRRSPEVERIFQDAIARILVNRESMS